MHTTTPLITCGDGNYSSLLACKAYQRRNVYFIKNIIDYPNRVIIQPDHLGQEVKALRDAGCQL